MHLDNYNDEYEERDKKFEIIRKNKANILIRTYVNYSIRNLYISAINERGYANDLIRNRQLEGCCWQNTEFMIPFFGKKSIFVVVI